MERSKTTEQGAVLTELNTEPRVIQFEYQSEIIETFTGKIKTDECRMDGIGGNTKKAIGRKVNPNRSFSHPGKTSHDFATGHNGSGRRNQAS